jgi:uncharacterized protein YicC (UPF0701 family)
MRRLFSVALASIFSMSLILGTSPVLAQTEEEPTQVPAVSSELMEELDGLVRMLEEAEHADDQELIEALQEKIKIIKEEIRHASETPTVVEESEEPQPIVEPPTVVATSQGIVSSTQIDWCSELKGLEEKRAHYEALYALSDKELEDRGYHRGKEEIRNTIRNLEEAIERARLACEGGDIPSSGGGTTTSPVDVTTETVAIKPIVSGSGGEIADYYRVRIAQIATEEVEIEDKIADLKELRNEIDKLIEELIKSKAEISAEEVSGLVTKIEVRPGEVHMDEVVVKTVDKSVVARIDNEDVAIRPTEAHVVLQDGTLTVKTPELRIENEALRVGESEVRLSPSTIVEGIKIKPKEIELKEENARAVYKIKTDEGRKLLGFIPIKVEKTLTLDAANTEVKITEEEMPWWTFLTTE